MECPNCGNKLEDDDADICPHCDFSMIDDDDDDSIDYQRRNRYLLLCLIIMLIIATPTITLMMYFPFKP